MKIRALDSNRDWTFGRGKQNYLADTPAIMQDIDTALWIFLGECFWAINDGVDWKNLLGGKDVNGIIIQCRNVIANRYGVVRINSIDSFFNRNSRRLSVKYDIDTIFTRNASSNIQVL